MKAYYTESKSSSIEYNYNQTSEECDIFADHWALCTVTVGVA